MIRRLLLRLPRLVAPEVAKSLAGKEAGPGGPSHGIAGPAADPVRFGASPDGPTSEEVNPTEGPMSS